MIAGRKDRFAIEAEVEEIVDGWVLGHFRFWLCGRLVGDWEDSADLRGCVRWLRDFFENPRDRFEADLVDLPAGEVFKRVYDRPMGRSTHGSSAPEVQNAFARFHISHLGMSSFERFDVLLLKDEHGAERCLWRQVGDDRINDCHLWRNEMEGVAIEFCNMFDRETEA
jgi:hypothetical protein